MPCRGIYFIVSDDGTFSRIAKKTFFRILEQHKDEVHLEFKKQRVKWAQIDVELEDNRPVSVVRESYGFLDFDEDGRFDSAAYDKYNDMLVGHWDHTKPDIEFTEEEQLWIDTEFTWKPSPALRVQLHRAALQNKRFGGHLH